MWTRLRLGMGAGSWWVEVLLEITYLSRLSTTTSVLVSLEHLSHTYQIPHAYGIGNNKPSIMLWSDRVILSTGGWGVARVASTLAPLDRSLDDLSQRRKGWRHDSSLIWARVWWFGLVLLVRKVVRSSRVTNHFEMPCTQLWASSLAFVLRVYSHSSYLESPQITNTSFWSQITNPWRESSRKTRCYFKPKSSWVSLKTFLPYISFEGELKFRKSMCFQTSQQSLPPHLVYI